MFFWGKRKNYISIYSLALCFCSLGQFFFVPFILQAYLEKRSWQYLKHHIKMVTLKDENVLFLEASGSFSSWGVFIDEYWCFLAYLYELRNLDCLFFSIWTMNELVVLILCQMCLERHVQSLSNTMYSILDVILHRKHFPSLALQQDPQLQVLFWFLPQQSLHLYFIMIFGRKLWCEV